jgi:Domain of unknown function (DUF4145)
MAWKSTMGLSPKRFTCGFCGSLVASVQGFLTDANPSAQIYICPNCLKPTYFSEKQAQVPGTAPGAEVAYLPEDVEGLYREARNSVAVGSYTAAVLSCRKLLMHIAVAQGAPPGKSFVEYVEHLASTGYVPPNGGGWVDHIRTKGNEANHEIRLMSKPDAEELISFAEMLLKFIYEFPERVPKPPAAP